MQSNSFSHVTCFYCVSHFSIQVNHIIHLYLHLKCKCQIQIQIQCWQHFSTRSRYCVTLTRFFRLVFSLPKSIGFELSFYSGVYSSSIGFTLKFGESAKQLVGLSGIFIGIGEIFGGVLFGLLGSKTIKFGRDPIVIVGFIVHLVSFLLIYLNLPDNAPCKFELLFLFLFFSFFLSSPPLPPSGKTFPPWKWNFNFFSEIF